MNRATPVQMRKSLEIVNAFKRAGIRFVPMPVCNEDEFNARMAEMTGKLDEIERQTEGEESKSA